MRRRQAYEASTPFVPPTEFEALNEASLPELAPRRRAITAAFVPPAPTVLPHVPADRLPFLSATPFVPALPELPPTPAAVVAPQDGPRPIIHAKRKRK